MRELKPCPFCGGKPEAITSDDGFTSIGCLSCNPVFGIMVQGMTEEDAYRCWNERHERTCRNKSVEGNRLLLCSKCGAFTKVTNATEYIDVRYCGNCGAKVVEK